MARQITLNDREWIEIVNSGKEVTGGFWWNPSDLDIAKRCENVLNYFNGIEVDKEADFLLYLMKLRSNLTIFLAQITPQKNYSSIATHFPHVRTEPSTRNMCLIHWLSLLNLK